MQPVARATRIFVYRMRCSHGGKLGRRRSVPPPPRSPSRALTSRPSSACSNMKALPAAQACGLQPTGYCGGHGSVASVAGEAAPQLGQPTAWKEQTGFEDLAGHLAGRVVVAGALHAQRNQGVVVRPDGAVVVAHRVEAGGVARERADAPAAQHVVGQQAPRSQPARRGRAAARSTTRGPDWRSSSRCARLCASRPIAQYWPASSATASRSSNSARARSAAATLHPFSFAVSPSRAYRSAMCAVRGEHVALDLGQRDRRLGPLRHCGASIESGESFQPWLPSPSERLASSRRSRRRRCRRTRPSRRVPPRRLAAARAPARGRLSRRTYSPRATTNSGVASMLP